MACSIPIKTEDYNLTSDFNAQPTVEPCEVGQGQQVIPFSLSIILNVGISRQF